MQIRKSLIYKAGGKTKKTKGKRQTKVGITIRRKNREKQRKWIRTQIIRKHSKVMEPETWILQAYKKTVQTIIHIVVTNRSRIKAKANCTSLYTSQKNKQIHRGWFKVWRLRAYECWWLLGVWVCVGHVWWLWIIRSCRITSCDCLVVFCFIVFFFGQSVKGDKVKHHVLMFNCKQGFCIAFISLPEMLYWHLPSH